jgi:hypothetical protein
MIQEILVKKLALAAFLMSPMLALAETPNPANYTVNVHIQSSRLVVVCPSGTNCGNVQYLNTVIGGKKFELERWVDGSVLRVGDYKARLIEGKQPRAEEYTRSYEFLFSDGKTGTFAVVGESE